MSSIYFIINLITFEVIGPFFGFKTAVNQRDKLGDCYIVVKEIVDDGGNLVR